MQTPLVLYYLCLAGGIYDRCIVISHVNILGAKLYINGDIENHVFVFKPGESERKSI